MKCILHDAMGNMEIETETGRLDHLKYTIVKYVDWVLP